MSYENFGTKDINNHEFSQVVYNNETYYVETSYYIAYANSNIEPVNSQNSVQTDENAGKALTTGEILGIVLISIAIVAAAIFVLVTILQKNKNKKEL